MRIGAIILAYEDVDYLPRAALSVAEEVWRVYVVDNGSSAAVVAELSRLCDERGYTLVATGENLGYGKGNNVGIERALADGCEGLLIMNNDAFAHPGAVAELASYLDERPEVGAVGPMVLGVSSGRVMHTAGRLDAAKGVVEWVDQNQTVDAADRRPRPTCYLSGEAFLARSNVLRECGGFDPRFHNYFEDAEWSVRVRRAGWEIHVDPAAVFDHVWGGTMPGLSGVFYRSYSRPLFLGWALGKPWWAAALRSAPPTGYTIMLLLRRGRIWSVLRGALFGWISGVARLVREPSGDRSALPGSDA